MSRNEGTKTTIEIDPREETLKIVVWDDADVSAEEVEQFLWSGVLSQSTLEMLCNSTRRIRDGYQEVVFWLRGVCDFLELELDIRAALARMQGLQCV